ncbi:MAG: hypothetical protein EXQ84_06010 [Rhodospirillaceae bacterium]|nr:hypothetical protein [Rhodospirillaceae bacterium]
MANHRSGSRMNRAGGIAAVLAAAMVLPAGLASSAETKSTWGFAVSSWHTAIYETRFMDECPEGINATNDEYWWRSLSKDQRGKLTNNGMTTQIGRQAIANHRGPNGEDICQVPTAVTDPPLLTVQSKTSYGLNLDGTSDGRETGKTCKHEKFTGVDGTPAVDNQLYRLLGCVYGWRSIGHVETAANGHRRTNGLGMILLEVTDVDDPRNDDDVKVTFYRSVDQFTFDKNDNPLPYSTYRIDYNNGTPRYGATLPGKIVNGNLTTESGDVSLPFYANYGFQTMRLRDVRIDVQISEDGSAADGILAAYYDTEQLWEYVGELGWQPTGVYNCPAIYAAMRKLADGYRDASGQCTAISSAFKIKAVAAFIRHGDPKTPTDVQAGR